MTVPPGGPAAGREPAAAGPVDQPAGRAAGRPAVGPAAGRAAGSVGRAVWRCGTDPVGPAVLLGPLAVLAAVSVPVLTWVVLGGLAGYSLSGSV
ncbi:MAG: hypothetical protein V7637_4855 [Mycobacteriales bacterium]